MLVKEGMSGGRRISDKLSNWCNGNLTKLPGNRLQEPAFVHYLVNLKYVWEIRDTLLENMRSNDRTRIYYVSSNSIQSDSRHS